MIDIRIEGEPCDMNPGANLVLERFNPLLSMDAVQGSRVYGFDLPATPTNRRLLGYFYQDQVGYQSRRFRCEKYMHSQLIEQGYVQIQEVKPEGFSVFFTQNLGEIFGDKQNLLLSEISFPAEPVPAAPVATANHLTDRYCYPTIANPALYGNQAIAGYNGLMNEYNAGAYAGVGRVPMPFLRAVFDWYSTLTGWSFAGQFWQDPDLARLILFNLYTLDGQATINPNNHLPALTMPQLLIDLRKLFNLFLEFDVRRKVCTMDFGERVMTDAQVVDWTDRAHPNHRKAPELENRLDISYDIDTNDALMKPIPALMDRYITPETTINQGGTALNIRSRISTLLTDPATGRATTAQAGISTNNKDNKTGSLPRLLFWNGMVGGIPTATAVQGGRSLFLSGANSLVDIGYRNFERFKGDTFSVTKIVFLSAADLATFSFRRRVHISGVNYIVGSLKASLGGNQSSVPTEVVLWRV